VDFDAPDLVCSRSCRGSGAFRRKFYRISVISEHGAVYVNPPTVDRTFKGDRLPVAVSADKIGAPASPTQQTRGKGPVGCDGAFSPISSPLLATVFRRCTV
jgi:hypothetical protein